jgi:hypothetical protein
MIMKALFLSTVLATAAAFAQGSGSIAAPPSVGGSDGAPFRITKSVTGVVQAIDAKSISVEDAKSRKPVELVLVPDSKIRVTGAAKALADVAKGATVRINYAKDDLRVLDIRVIKGDK